MLRNRLPLTAFCLVLILTCAHGRESPNLVKVQTATFVGDEGTEWLTSGAFPGDDSILVAGVTLAPDLSLRGVKARVIGKDGPPIAAPTAYQRLGQRETGRVIVPDIGDAGPKTGPEPVGGLDKEIGEPPTKQELEQKQKENLAKLGSVPHTFQFAINTSIEAKDYHARLYGGEKAATGFIARFDSTLARVRALSRLGRGAGTISSIAVGRRGEIYIAGAGTDLIASVGGQARMEKLDNIPPDEKFFPFAHTYIARLSPDLSEAIWVRQIKAASFAPELRALKNGNVAMIGPSYLVYDPDGKLVQATFMDKSRVASGSAVCPVTGRYTRVGDWMSPTGREPYRCPRLIIYEPDGATHKYLQGWRGSFFCPNHFHLVADSAVRRSAYDDQGNLFYSTWSHGGNNCMGRLPYDAERVIPDGLGYGGSQTYCFVVKLDPEHNVKAGTLWTSAGSILTLAATCDGSVVWSGSAKDTPKLPNTLASDGATQLAVVEPNLSAYRFYSAMPAVGTRVVVGGCADRIKDWAFASGTCDGKPMLLCVSGAVSEEPTPDKGKETPPLKNPVQDKFAGGLMDGYALLMDLTAQTPLAFEPPVREARPHVKKPYSGPPLIWPVEGQEWLIGTEKCITVKVTFRDEPDKMWPSFFMGRGEAGGKFTFGKRQSGAKFTLDCPAMLQIEGLQHQRVLGQLVGVEQKGPDGQALNGQTPIVKVHVTAMSPWEDTGDTYDHERFPVGRCTIAGTLEFNGRRLPFKDAPCRSSFSYPHRDVNVKWTKPNYALPSATFAVSGGDLGLKGPLADQRINVAVAWEAVSQVKPEPRGNEEPKLDDLMKRNER
jgi:hypothetical protein